MSTVVEASAKVVAYANYVRKALVTAAGVLVTISATAGVPTDAKAVIANVLAALAAFGVTYKVSNAPKP